MRLNLGKGSHAAIRQTAKYKAAEVDGVKLRLKWGTSEELYEQLQNNGYMWDSKAGEWLHLPSMEADEPSPLIKVRAWAELGNVEAVSDSIIGLMEYGGYQLAEKSKVLPCRPPKQLEGRVYLTFLPNK